MALAAGRPNVIHLEVREPDFPTPAPIIDAAFAAARAGFTKYSPNADQAMRLIATNRRSGPISPPEA